MENVAAESPEFCGKTGKPRSVQEALQGQSDDFAIAASLYSHLIKHFTSRNLTYPGDRYGAICGALQLLYFNRKTVVEPQAMSGFLPALGSSLFT